MRTAYEDALAHPRTSAPTASRSLAVAGDAPQEAVCVTDGTNTFRTNVAARTVADVFKGTGKPLTDLDKVKPAPNTPIRPHDRRHWIRTEESTVTEKFSATPVTKEDPTLVKDRGQVEDEGKPGTRRVTYRLTIVNGTVTTERE